MTFSANNKRANRSAEGIIFNVFWYND